MAIERTRVHYSEELGRLEEQGLGGLDMVISALDPIATLRIEELIESLKRRYTIVIVTHNMQQAARVADRTAFMLTGELVEFTDTETIFTTPSDTRTEENVTGKFG